MPTGPKPVTVAMPKAPPPEHVYTTYAEMFPPAEGPPPVANYQGRKVLAAAQPRFELTLDSGAFRAVWELVEATAKARWEVRGSMASAAAYVRAVEAFRAANKTAL